MKTFIGILTIFLFTFTCDAQHQEVNRYVSDNVFFNGYFLILYKKTEINELEKNRRRKLQGKSYQIPFETSSLRFFVSKDSLSKKSLASIVEDLPKKNKGEVFIECNEEFTDALSEAFSGNGDALFHCEWPQMRATNKYFTCSKRSRYCFKIFEISGWFKQLKIVSEKQRDAIGKKIAFIDSSLKEFDAYFFTSCESYHDYTDSLSGKIYLWKEVPPIFD